MTAFVDDGVEFEMLRIEGWFVGETGDYWLYQEISYEESPYRLEEVWHLPKDKFKGEVELNKRGHLNVEDSYFPEEINGDWFIIKGSGTLITFDPIPF